MSFICNKCMAKIDSRVCPHCGDDNAQPQNSPMLALGTVLAGRYRIGRCTRAAGDGFTYAALDTVSNAVVSVTEFFPTNVVLRADDGVTVAREQNHADYFAELYEDFSDLVVKLTKLSEKTGLVQLLGSFEENATRYYVCAHFDSMPLVDVVSEFRKTTGKIWDKISPIFDSFLAELEILHHLGLVHRGIDDKSVLLCSDGTIKLDAFSIASARINGKGLRAVISPQYAAPEQFCGTPYPDRTCDIYSVCAVMFFCATGRVFDRDKMNMPEVFFGEDVPVHVVNAIVKGLSADPEHRFPSVGELRAALYGGASAEPVRQVPGTVKTTKKRFVLAIFAASVLIMFGLVTAGLYFIFDINLFKLGSEINPDPTSSREIVSLPEQSSNVDAVVNVPSLIGLNYGTVEEMYGNSEKFTLLTKLSDFNDTYPRNYIMAQTPDAGTPSPGLTTITVTLSRGPTHVVMPKVIGLKLDDAYKLLTDLGFQVYLVEVDSATALPTVGASQQYAKGVVLDCPNRQGSIVRAESTIALYGILDEYATGNFTTSTAADGTVTGVLTPAPKTLHGTVIEQPNADGTVTYLLQGETIELTPSAATSQSSVSVPQGGTVSTVSDYFGNVYTYFTYDPVVLEGTITKTVSATGTVVYIQQLPPKTVAVETVETKNADGTVSVTYHPAGGMGGADIPKGTVTTTVGSGGAIEYIVTPHS